MLPVVWHSFENVVSHIKRGLNGKISRIKCIKKIFVSKKDDVTDECRKLHNAELHALYSLPTLT